MIGKLRYIGSRLVNGKRVGYPVLVVYLESDWACQCLIEGELKWYRICDLKETPELI